MPAAAVTAAIIGAISTGAATASQQLHQSIRDAGSSSVGGVLVNESHQSYNIKTYSPNHGHYVKAPSVYLPGYFYEYSKFMAAVKDRFGNSFTTSDEDDMLAEWTSKNLFDAYAKGTNTTLDGIGSGAGFECALRLDASGGGYFHQIAIVIRKKPGGNYGVGLGIANFDFYSDKKNDKYGDFILDHIKDVHTKHCQYSDGGGSISVELGGITVSASAPGEVNTIVIKDS